MSGALGTTHEGRARMDSSRGLRFFGSGGLARLAAYARDAVPGKLNASDSLGGRHERPTQRDGDA